MRRFLLVLSIASSAVAQPAGKPAQPAADAKLAPLQDILKRAGKAVERFWDQFSAINCTESVLQAKLDKDGRPAQRRESSFDYLAVMQIADDELSVEESRLPVKASAKGKQVPLLVTNGFSTLLFVFHPYYQGSYEYSQPEPQELLGKKALRIQFRQVRGARSPACLRLRGREYPLEWRGEAWADPQTGAILKISADLNTPMEDVGLRALKAEVTYAPTRFAGVNEEFWLPSVAVVDAETPRQHWRNIHRFANYKRFAVETTDQVETPK